MNESRSFRWVIVWSFVFALAMGARPASAQTRRVELAGLPPLDLPASFFEPPLDAVLAIVDRALRDRAPTGLPAEQQATQQRAWEDRRGAAMAEYARAFPTLRGGQARTVAAMASAVLMEDIAAHVALGSTALASVRTSLEQCAAVRLPELQPWVARCSALVEYWNAMDRYEGARAHCAVEGDPAETPPEAEPTLAVLIGSATSLLPARDAHALRTAVVAAVPRWAPGLHVLSVDELEATERDSTGSACLSEDLEASLARAHANLWTARVSAHCPDAGLAGTCTLTVSFGSERTDEPLPPDRSVDLGTASATIDDFVHAVTRLQPQRPGPFPRGGRFGFLGWSAPSGELWGSSPAFPASTVLGVLTPSRSELATCRDLDASPVRSIEAALEVAPSGRVRSVTLSSRIRGARRRACVERVFGALRFPRSASRSVISVSGSFGLSAPPTTSLRSTASALFLPIDPRTADALLACHSTAELDVVPLDVDIASDGSVHASPTDGSPLAACFAQALSHAAGPCGAPAHRRVTVCVGNPPRPVHP